MDNQPTPVAVQQTTVIQVGSQKSVAGAVLLALFFGPLGMIYSTVPGALIMLVINIFVAVVTLGLGLLITAPICAIWAGIAASNHNKQLGISSQHAALAGQGSPAGWHQDPAGSGRLRYYDGMRWTDHYADHAPEPQPPAAVQEEATPQLAEAPEAEPEPGGEEDESEAPTAIATVDIPAESEPQQVFCGSCGSGVSSSARFCSACGEAQAEA